MATNRFHRLLVLAAAVGLSVLPARAQLDTRLQASKTDFLDLYQQTNNATLKPEVVTIFDFSGSTQNLMYHKNFPNIDSNDNDNPNGGGQLKITVKRSGSGTKASPYTYAVSGTLAGAPYDPSNAQSGFGTYGDSNSVGLTFIGLVRPDGSLVTNANVNTMTTTGFPGDTSSPRESDPRNWIRCASHARFQLNGAVRTGGTSTRPVKTTYNRTLDIPLAWTIMDATCTGYPLNALQVDDTAGGTASKFDFDSTYANTTGSVFSGGGAAGTSSKTAYVATTGYAPNYIGWLFQAKNASGAFYVPDTTTAAGQAFGNGIPAFTRCQAVKFAALKTWVAYQTSVVWAYRFLDASDEQNVKLSTDSTAPINSSNVTTSQVYGADRGWTLFNGTATQTSTAIKRLAALFPANSTPLTYAEANAYAQFQDTSATGIFNGYEKGTNKPQDCMKHFLIVFTDGQPNGDGSPTDKTPYITSGTSGDANTGNGVILGGKSALNPNGGAYWNIQTLSAVAAHGADPSLTNRMSNPGSYSATGNPSDYAPFWINGRGTGTDAVNGNGKFSTPHAIQTMTVGLSLGGSYTDGASGKARLFQAAVFGDPNRDSWDLSTLTPFTFSDPADPTSLPTSDSAYYFDATDPQALVEGLGAAFRAIKSIGTTATASAPTTPPVGLSLGNQVYLGSFYPPTTGGPVWPGDLLMYATHSTSTNTYLIGNDGSEVTSPDASNAQWAASVIFANSSSNPSQTAGKKKWSSRVVWTRLPATSTTPNPGLVRFQPSTANADGTTNTWGSDAAYNAIKAYVGPATLTDVQRNKLIDYVLGASTSSTGPAYANRSDIMGDIVDSAPTSLEYNWSQVSGSVTAASSILSAATSAAAAGNPGSTHFRLIFVGDNQGYLHAFGELSWSVNVPIHDPSDTSVPPDPSKTILIPVTKGAVDELWAFLPTDFLANLNYLQDATNSHRFMVDGSPYAYFLDAPASNSIAGNGMVDTGERALVIFGLRKGGRSYYALDVSNPLTPKLGPAQSAAGWAIRPDDAMLIPSTSLASPSTAGTIAQVRTIVGTMGYSTCQPFIGRVLYGSSPQTIRDVVFLGGGYSTTDVDAQTLNTSVSPNTAAALGRSALAIDVNTGQYLMAWDLTKSASTPAQIGPVGAGVVPVTLNQTSGLVSRAYFNDYSGNLWALGSAKPGSNAGPGQDFSGFRVDSNVLDQWTTDGTSTGAGGTASIRLVYAQAPNNGILSTLPAPFLIGGFPSVRYSSPQVAPYAVGIAVNSGDRNNPLDRNYSTLTNPAPTQHRLTVVFDRQDSKSLSLDTKGIQTTQLMNLGTASTANVTEGSGSFYLADSGYTGSAHGLSNYGYYLNYPTLATAYVNKAINDPLVVAYSLFFSYFEPTSSDPCTGGAGDTVSSRITDAVHPTFPGFLSAPTPGGAGNSNPSGFTSGVVAVYSGVATNYSPQGTTTVSQGGTVPTGSNGVGLTIQNIAASASQRFPRPRTWRVIR